MRAISHNEARLWFGALVAFGAFGLLGANVAWRTPARIDLAATAVRGRWTPLAAFFTALGRAWVLVPVGGLAAVLALALRQSALPVAGILVSQTLSQAVAGAAKSMYGRARPDDWLFYRERGLSYPSGHAATTVVFYVALGLLALRCQGLPRPFAFGCALAVAVCVVGIPWSRIALGAHYATDVLGGLLFGAGWLCASVAAAYRFGWLP